MNFGVPIEVGEALFPAWQESAWKDVERFYGVLKKKFQVCKHGTNMMNYKNINVVIACCVMLHNMMVVEHVQRNQDEIESADFYEVVREEEESEFNTAASPDYKNILHFVQQEEDNVETRLLEVEYLQVLGINIHDSELQNDTEKIRVLPLLTRMAMHRWGQLYNLASHKKLQSAISSELHRKYKDAKKGTNKL
jgi:hypothetical protein